MSDTSTEAPPTPSQAVEDLYEWSTWVHVGPGAEQCEAIDEDKGTNSCSNPLHFHGWCRLPNQYQHREIREAAMAARARKIRQLRDPDSNASVVLDMELDELAAMGEEAKQIVITEVVSKEWWRDYMEAQAVVQDVEEDDGTKTYAHIQQDMVRWTELSEMDPDYRPEDEYLELESHISTYNLAIDEEQQNIRRPREDALKARDVSDLLDELRRQRVDVASNEEFGHEYATLEWLHCTLTHPDGSPVFASRDVLVKAPENVLEALKATYVDLERTQREGGGPGN